MTKRKVGKYVGIITALTVVCTAALLLVVRSNVFGLSPSYKQYIDKTKPIVNSVDSVVVTDEGGNRKGDEGSKKTPMETDEVKVPTVIGKKGTESNPFVLLEIVPDKAMQQMAYLTGNREDSGLDAMQIGIDAMNKYRQRGGSEKYASFADSPSLTNLGIRSDLGEWFCEYPFQVRKIGSETEKEDMKLAEIGQYYTIKIKPEDISLENGYSKEQVDRFAQDLQDHKDDMAYFLREYPQLFIKDDKGNEIREIAKEDSLDWRLETRNSRGSIYHEVELTSEDISGINEWNYGYEAKKFIQNNPDLFTIDSEGKEINKAACEDLVNWSVRYRNKKNYDYIIKTTSISAEHDKAYEEKEMSVIDLIRAYPDLFIEDTAGTVIEPDRLEKDEWQAKKEEINVSQNLNSGYIHYLGENKGNYKCGREYYPYNGYVIQQEEGGEWEYLEELPEGAVQGESPSSENDLKNPALYWDVNDAKSVYWAESVYEIHKETQYTFTYQKSVDYFTFIYDGGEKVTSLEFVYYGLKTNNILKRSLFAFNSEEECENFHMNVVCMTPSELNRLSKKDRDDTLDMIERADMYYIASYNSSTNALDQVYNLYHRFILNEKNYKFDTEKEKLKSFYQNDLEWDLCIKILKRATTNQNLPIMYTQAVGDLLDRGLAGGEPGANAETWLYLSSEQPNWWQGDASAPGTLNNIAKLYLISIQFDFYAKKEDGYIRTFTEDILSNIKTASLVKDAVPEADPDSATTTGYYEREGIKAVNGNLDEDDKERCFYLWNVWTFYPSAIAFKDPLSESTKERLVPYGYAETYFATNTGTPFQVTATHQGGSDGTDNQNVAIVHQKGNVSNVNFSTMISGTSENNGGIVSPAMEAAFQIMNRQPEIITPLTVAVVKQKKLYEKISDDQIFIDYKKEADYETDKTLYVKVIVQNVNNEDGIIKSIALVNEDGETPSHYGDNEPDALPSLDGTQPLEKENILDSKGKNGVKGYRVKDTLTFYVPYQRSDWQNGYDTIRFEMQGRIFSPRQKKSVLGSVTTSDILISERELFNLI